MGRIYHRLLADAKYYGAVNVTIVAPTGDGGVTVVGKPPRQYAIP
jgi:hypothetical protein